MGVHASDAGRLKRLLTKGRKSVIITAGPVINIRTHDSVCSGPPGVEHCVAGLDPPFIIPITLAVELDQNHDSHHSGDETLIR